jgi:hypothetical protein
MSFLDSPQVQQGLEEAHFLRERLIRQTEVVMATMGEDKEVAIEYLHTLYALIEKEHGLYTRFRLSNDSEALIAASELDGAKVAADLPEFVNADEFYRKLKDDLKEAIFDVTGEDMNEPYEPT